MVPDPFWTKGEYRSLSMKTYLSVPISDAVNRHNMKADTGGLHNAILQVWPAGLPVCVQHDRHRLAGWMFYVGLHFEPGLTRVVGRTIVPDDTEGWNALSRHYLDRLGQRTREATRDSIETLRQLIGSHLDGSEQIIDISATALIAPDLARRVFPSIFAREDKDGLIPLSVLEQIHPGMFRIGDLLLLAHPFFRRGESRLNTLNVDLLHCLQDHAADTRCTAKIRLDPDVVGLAATAESTFEFEYWYGPRFSDDVSSLQPGVTVHGADDGQRILHEVVRTEFWWQARFNDALDRDELILEVEELRNTESRVRVPDSSEFRCRYVHSIVGRDNTAIDHIDGAIRGYTLEKMIDRLDHDIKQADRHTAYTKLWRIDGNIELHQWKKLVHHHFRGNPLVSEYLGVPVNLTFPNEAAHGETTDVSDPRHDLLPFRIHTGDGIRLTLSYPQLRDRPIGDQTFVVARQLLKTGTRQCPVFDLSLVDLKKVLASKGHFLRVPSDAAFYRYEDRYHELPLILHHGAEAVEATIEAYRNLLTSWRNEERDLVLALSLALVEGERVVSLSLYGHIQHILEWLLRARPFPPSGDRDLWVNETAEYLAQYGQSNDAPALSKTVAEDDLTFRVGRVMLPEDCAVWESGGLFIATDKLQPNVVQALENNLIQAAGAYWVRDLHCSICSGNYLACKCTAVLERNAYNIKDQRFAYLFWTDRRVSLAQPENGYEAEPRAGSTFADPDGNSRHAPERIVTAP